MGKRKLRREIARLKEKMFLLESSRTEYDTALPNEGLEVDTMHLGEGILTYKNEKGVQVIFKCSDMKFDTESEYILHHNTEDIMATLDKKILKNRTLKVHAISTSGEPFSIEEIPND